MFYWDKLVYVQSFLFQLLTICLNSFTQVQMLYMTFCTVLYANKMKNERGHAKNTGQVDVQMDLTLIWGACKEL